MILAVLDTNVLASGFIGESKPDSVPGALIKYWRIKAFTLVISEQILDELATTFATPNFANRLSSLEIAAALGFPANWHGRAAHHGPGYGHRKSP